MTLIIHKICLNFQSIIFVLIAALLITSTLSSCSGAKKAKANAAKLKEETFTIAPDVVEEPVPEPVVVEEPKLTKKAVPHLIVSMERTPCFGNCPVFEVRLFSDGRLIYKGKKNVEKIGTFETRVDQNFIDKLISVAHWKGFFSLADKYPIEGPSMTDFPSTFTYIFSENQGKSIQNNYDSPLALRELEMFFEERFEELNWRVIEGNQY